MNWNVLGILYQHELKMLVRTKRTVAMSIILPAIIMPIMLFAARYNQERRERSLHETAYRYAVTGPLRGRLQSLITKTQEWVAHHPGNDFG